MFESILQDLEKKLSIPYPERTEFIREVASDLEHAYQQHRTAACDEKTAMSNAVRDICLSNEDIEGLNAAHEATASQLMRRLPRGWPEFISDFSGIVPLVIFILFVKEESSMIDFLREGGVPFIVALFFIGGIGIAVDMRHAFRWFVVRDHSEKSLSSFSTTPLYLAAVSVLVGVIATAVDYRLVFAHVAKGNIGDLYVGLSEPLSALIVAAALAGIIVLLHGWLSAWRQRTVGANS